MQIRLATLHDIPEIIQVLKMSLGESKLPKSEEIWRYKHLENPFGESIVLLAVEENKIIGVRAFMRWKWQLGKEIFSSLRAVDTATHPDYRGRGIFKELTLRAVGIAKDDNDQLIFNTPNSQSLPGYLKMGWKEIDKLSIRLIPVNPFHWKLDIKETYEKEENSLPHVEKLTCIYNELQEETNKLFTPKNFEYLNWRYKYNPLQTYKMKSGKNFFVAGYVKKHRFFRELRITESIYIDEKSKKDLKKEILKWGLDSGSQVISLADRQSDNLITFGIRGEYGPVLTLKNLNLRSDTHSSLLDIKNWEYSIGDLELF